MQQFSNVNGNLMVLQRGDELFEQLEAYAKQHRLKSAWMSGLGGAGATTLGFYDIEKKEYEWKEFAGPMEILNLTGNLTWVDGEPFWHIHGTLGDHEMRAIGGHVKQMEVGLTCEIFITTLETPLTRIFDDETGLKLIT